MGFLQKDTVPQKNAVDNSIERFKYNRDRPWGLYGHDMGVHPLNMTLGGWIPTKLTVIAARSGHGKTALSVPMFQAGNRIMNGRKAAFLFFSWETESSYMVDRDVCNQVGITNKVLTQGAKLIGSSTLNKIEKAYEKAKDLPVIYHENSTNINYVCNLYDEFCDLCESRSKQEGIDIIPILVVDYIGLAEFGKNDIRSYDVAEFCNSVKKKVNDRKGAACLFAQLKRSSDQKSLPERDDLSDSQAIEQAADNLVILHRPEYNGVDMIKDPSSGIEVSSKDKAIFRVLKAREYGTGDLLLACDIKYYRFHDIEHLWDFPYWNMYEDKNFWLRHFGLEDKEINVKENFTQTDLFN